MQCSNCGAMISDDALTCPYCGCENETKAEAQHLAEVSGIYAGIAALLKLPEQTIRRASRILLRVFLILIGVFLAALLIAFIYSHFAPELAYQKQQDQLQTLEELYQGKDYSKMYETLQGMEDSYNAVYDKYFIIGWMAEDLEYTEENCPETAEFVAGFPDGADLLDYDLENLFGLLAECAALAEAGYVYGEEEAVAELTARARTLLTETLRLTEDEIETGIKIAKTEEPDYTELRELSAKRLTGGKK